MSIQPMSEINQKIDAISQIVVADLLELVQNEGQLEDRTFILAGVIANICGWYTATLNEIQPSLNDIFHGMIEKSIQQYEDHTK